MSISDLEAFHPDAQPDRVADYIALYEGGTEFDARRDDLIIRRKIEEKTTASSPFSGYHHYQQRKKRSQYVNRAGGMVDWIVSAVTKKTPTLHFRDYESVPESALEFWSDLVLDADGFGTPLPNVIRELVKDELVTRRAALEVVEDETTGRLCLRRLEPSCVLDWCDEFTKVKFVGYERSKPYGPVDLEKHCWVYYFADGSTTSYVAYKKFGDTHTRKSDSEVLASDLGFAGGKDDWVDRQGNLLDQDDPHAKRDMENSFGANSFGNPIVMAEIPRSQWLIDRVADVVKALFNAELDLSFALSQAAYPQPILKLDNPERAKEIVQSEMAVFLLMTTESFEYVSPKSDAFESLFKNVDRLKMSLHESVQMVSKEIMNVPQVGRMSAEALREIQSPVEAMLVNYTWPIADLVMNAVNRILESRGEERLDLYLANFGEVIVTPEMQGELDSILLGQEQNGRDFESGTGTGAAGNGSAEERPETESGSADGETRAAS